MFEAPHFIAWIRLCRPGSIIGEQQLFLVNIEAQIMEQGKSSKIWQKISQRFSPEEIQEKMERIRKRRSQ
jgi:cell division cycle 14